MRGFIEGAPNSLPLQRPTLTGGFDNALVQGLTVRVLPEAKAGGPVLDDRQAVTHDPSTANTGDGLPLYVATAQTPGSFPITGTKLNYRSSDGTTTYTLPFAFPFYGQSYTTAYINTNGYIQFGTSASTRGPRSR